MRDFFNKESKVNDIIIYRISSTKARIAIGQVITNGKKRMQLKSIAIEDGHYKYRKCSTITKGVFFIVNDKDLQKVLTATFEALCPKLTVI